MPYGAEFEAVPNPPFCPSGGAWVGPDVGSTVAWQDTGDNRAPLVASVLEQFGRMTALAKETTSNLLTSTAYWGAQPGQHHLTSLHQCCALHPVASLDATLLHDQQSNNASNLQSPPLLKCDDAVLAGSLGLKVLRLSVTWSLCIRLQHSCMRQPMLPHMQPEYTHSLLLRSIWLLCESTSAMHYRALKTTGFEDHRL